VDTLLLNSWIRLKARVVKKAESGRPIKAIFALFKATM
jgi:hypothetical protein